MPKKLSVEEERKAIEADEKKLAARRTKLAELEQSERIELISKSVLNKAPLDELKGFLNDVKKLGFAESYKRIHQ